MSRCRSGLEHHRLRRWDLKNVYLSPVASSLCANIAEKYSLEPCKAPARDEPNMAFVFGDPRVMGQLRDSVDTDALVVS